MSIGDWILLATAAVVAVPFVVLSVEALAALFPKRQSWHAAPRQPCLILIPAHNEADCIAATLTSVRSQLAAGDRVLVVADNCTDATAALARTAGVEVVERHDPQRRGKGYALDCGVRHVDGSSIGVFVIVDADSELLPGALDALVRQAAATQQPAQGIYLIGTGRESDPRRRLSAFAVLLKNKIRPLGLHRLGLPCLLTGSGMAIPSRALDAVPVGTSNIVEDMQLGIDLALAGFAPRLCPAAVTTGAPAPNTRSTIGQRTRWEHGHVRTLLVQTPRLLYAGIMRFRPGLIGLALELVVPPLSLLFVTWAVYFAVCLCWWRLAGGSWTPAGVLAGCLCSVIVTVSLAWWKFGRKMTPISTLLLAPVYILWKIPIYLKLLVAREKKWLRTERSSAAQD